MIEVTGISVIGFRVFEVTGIRVFVSVRRVIVVNGDRIYGVSVTGVMVTLVMVTGVSVTGVMVLG